jgi:hypothetical protein
MPLWQHVNNYQNRNRMNVIKKNNNLSNNVNDKKNHELNLCSNTKKNNKKNIKIDKYKKLNLLKKLSKLNKEECFLCKDKLFNKLMLFLIYKKVKKDNYLIDKMINW